MPYSKKNINSFGSLNVGLRPESIADQEAQDIINWRHAKTGWLVSRNGVSAYLPQAESEDYVPSGVMQTNNGVFGIGEFVLKDAMSFSTDSREPYDNSTGSYTNVFPLSGADASPTSRFMVYAARSYTPDPSDPDTNNMYRRYKAAYVLSPLDGPWANQFYFMPNADTSNASDPDTALGRPLIKTANRKYNTPPKEIYAPKRWLGDFNNYVDLNTDLAKDTNWIDHYVSMKQYRNVLVISDRTNNDMLLVDEYNESISGETPKHYIRLQENTLATFDIDIISLDYGLETNGHNNTGVENGLALYKFYGQKRQMQAYDDKYTEFYMSRTDISPLLDKGVLKWPINVSPYSELNKQDSCFILLDYVANDFNEGIFESSLLAEQLAIQINRDTQYIFSNADRPDEFFDVLSAVSFENPDSKETDVAADTYIWEDHKITYVPCTGISANWNYLTDEDKTWDKKTPVVPRSLKLTTKAGIEQEVPLGVWSYRFIWDFGNGEYSAPSTPITVSDILWSAMDDNTAASAGIGGRPVDLGKIKQEIKHGFASDADMLTEDVIVGWNNNPPPGPIYEDTSAVSYFTLGGEFNDFALKFIDLKKRLLSTPHRFAPDFANINSVSAETKSKRGDAVVTTTLIATQDLLPLKGVALEYGWSETEDFDNLDDMKYIEYRPGQRQLVVPLFKQEQNTATHNSVFSDNGVYRKIYQNNWDYFPPDYDPNAPVVYTTFKSAPEYQIVFGGRFRLGYDYSGNRDIKPELLESENIYFNLVPFQRDWGNAVTLDRKTNPHINDMIWDRNNDLDSSQALDSNGNVITGNPAIITREDQRNQTLVRAVKDERDRLSLFKPDVPPEVVSRILLSGMAEFILADYGDVGSWIEGRMIATRGFAEQNASPNAAHSYTRELALPNVFVNTVSVYSRRTAGDPVTILTDNGTPYSPRRFYWDNLKVVIYLKGERLLLPEQLSAYFPSSLLFGYPRVKIKIAASDIPAGAKKVLVFRTLSSHDNNYDPERFALAETLEITDSQDVEWIDEIKDEELDFAQDPLNYEGFTRPLASRFNLPLNERVYYANFVEEYQPQKPRENVTNVLSARSESPAVDSNWSWKVFPGNTALTNQSVEYAFAFKDATGQLSKSSQATITFGANDGKVVFFNLPMPYGAATKTLEVYRNIASGGWKKIGYIDNLSEGIFQDEGKVSTVNLANETFEPSIVDYESGLRWSEPYTPYWVKLESFSEVRSGDGDKITGIEQLYGNLLVFKERTIHRLAVQATDPPISRIDEISNNIGCIAPNTIININNEVYFLSRDGFCRYDNNKIEKADGLFAEELDVRIRDMSWGGPNPGIRDSACAYNPTYRELYLNIPIYSTYDPKELNNDPPWGPKDQLGLRLINGQVYVINLDSGFVTKFSYQTDYGLTPSADPSITNYERHPRVAAKLYHTNSYGQLRSAEVLPPRFNSTDPRLSLRSSVFLESPTNNSFQDMFRYFASAGHDLQSYDYDGIELMWKSKDFTGEDKSMIKRIRKVFAFLRSGGSVSISGESLSTPEGATSPIANMTWTRTYVPTTGEFEAIPEEGNSNIYPAKERGERVNFTVKCEAPAQLESFSFYWLPINQYER